MKKLVLGALALVGALSLSACGKSVQVGEVGVKVRTLWNAGVDPQPLPQGWHLLGLGEDIISYSVTNTSYPFTREADERGPENEEVAFNDNRGLPMTGDVQINASARPDCVVKLYTTWKQDFMHIIHGPLYRDLQAAIAAETEKTTVENLYSGGRQQVVANALRVVQAKWHDQCVEVTQLSWIGPIRYPDTIVQAIQRKTQTDQDTQNALAKVAQAKAEADAKIEEARGIAESNKLLAQSVARDKEVLQLKAIEKWNGVLPVYMGGNTPVPFLNVQ